MVRIRSLVKSLGSYALPSLRTTHKPLATVSAEYCYSIFLRNVALLGKAGLTRLPDVIAELGPGSSFGTGFAALIAGARKYYALDLSDHSNQTSNLQIFDELVPLFRKQASIPTSGAHSLIFPDLASYEFPAMLSLDRDFLSEARLQAIRNDIVAGERKFFEVAAPWADSNIVSPASVDWIFSHSVMEHVEDLDGTYRSMAQWLKPGAVASHLIDFDSHGLTNEWNGHWKIGERLWTILQGKRPYLLNRQWYGVHTRLAAENGFTVRSERRNKRFDGLIRDQFDSRFQGMSNEDARTRMVAVIHQRA
jgi:SAM-dependent methyltransferase